MMTRIALPLLIACFFPFLRSVVAEKPRPTNIVFILIDDLGWRDLGCYGSSYYNSPNIDRLASSGMRFSNGYAACNVCSPTRAAIMTGKYPARLLLTQWLPSGRWDAKKYPMREARYLSNLPLEEITIAETLREHGYRTAFFGKWHLGTETYYYPEHNGFELNVAGRDYGAPGKYFYPFTGSWTIPTTGLKLNKSSPIDGKPGDYLTDRLAEEADEFIRNHSKEPFFVMLSHYSVHAPLQGKKEKVKKFEAIAKQRPPQEKPAYAAMVESVDESVGRILNTLDELDLAEHTMVVFTSDNGGFAKATNNAPLRANKGSNYEGGIRVPLIIRAPGVTKPGTISNVPVISTDFYPTILDVIGLPPVTHQHVDGESLLVVLKGNETLDRDAIYWHYPHYNQHPQSFPSGVIRRGNWKLIENYENGSLSLYDLENDTGEQTDLAMKRPELRDQLHQQLIHWKRSVGADPMTPNPEFNESNQ